MLSRLFVVHLVGQVQEPLGGAVHAGTASILGKGKKPVCKDERADRTLLAGRDDLHGLHGHDGKLSVAGEFRPVSGTRSGRLVEYNWTGYATVNVADKILSF